MRRKVNLDRAGSDFFGVEKGKLRSGWLGISRRRKVNQDRVASEFL